MLNIGKNLKQLRSVNNMLQRDLAILLGCTASSVSDWETGKAEPSIDTLMKLVRIFNISYEELVL